MIIVHWLWCLPQTLAGLIYRAFVKVDHKEKRGNAIIYYITRNKGSSVSLGHRVFIKNWNWNDEFIVKHELGHYKQSLMLGWLYLLVIVIPSMLWNVWGHKRALKKDPNISYYDYWCEKWACKLGGCEND